MSTTDPDATIMLSKDGAHLGYQTHYVVDGGEARIILAALVALAEVMETQHIRAYVALPDNDHRTAYFSSDRFRYEADRDVYLCPAGKELYFDRPHSRRSTTALP